MSGPVERLAAAGMGAAESERKGRLLESARAALDARGAGPGAAHEWFVPGRIEFLGKHTDYAGGRSLVCAIERGVCFVAKPRAGQTLRMVDAGSGARCALEADSAFDPLPGDWTTYPATVVRRLARDFPGFRAGLDLAFASDLPPAAGLSSSSALVVGTYLALAAANRLEEHPRYLAGIRTPGDLATYLGAVENGLAFGDFPADRGVGTQGGSQDQTAILYSRPGALLQCRFVPVVLERHVPLPADHTFVIAVSGVVSEKIGGARDAYNAASNATATLLALWNRAAGRSERSLGAVFAPPGGELPVERNPAAAAGAARLAELVARDMPAPDRPALLARLDQFLTESLELIPAAGEALLAGDLAALGAVVDRSQAGAEGGLHNQIAETVHLQRRARGLGAAAASAFGAGFGGAVWALVPARGAGEFRADWERDYLARFPEHAERAGFFETRAGPAALRLDV